MKIQVLTNFSCPNSRAFNFPIILSKKLLEKKNIKTEFLLSYKAKINSDVLVINSNVFRPFWRAQKDLIFNFLERYSKITKLIWCDTTDSTWCTQFEVLPYVHRFLKAQILKDKYLYTKSFKTGRIYTDFFESLYHSGEKEVNYPSVNEEFLSKIDISWNSYFENYNENRYSILRKFQNYISDYFPYFFPNKLNIDFTPPTTQRLVKISCRIGTSHSRPSVTAHRKAVIEILKKFSVQTKKLSLKKYFQELRNSQIAVSPFGVGEITLRDFEIFIAGATLLKPDMSHLQTWPELFISNQTYIPFKWDLTDLNDKIELLLQNESYRINIAKSAQENYKKYLSFEGIQIFAERFLNLISTPSK